jgi:multiple sugar transport system ATP-binding protein
MVFQNYALYPHMSVFENMAFGLKLRKVPKDQIKMLVDEAAKILDIAHLLDRKPKALSGGQRQRVALGRAIVRDPQVFLLDEPLSNLDAKLRAQMRTELSKLHKKLGTTFIYVTHDQIEAMTMGDRIVVMKDGYIQQIDSPMNLYANPVNKFVAGFIGSPQMNFIEAKLVMLNNKYTVEFGSEDTKTTRGRKFYVEVPAHKVNDELLKPYLDKDVILGIRPENISDEEYDISNARTGVIEAVVDVTEMMGAETYLYLTCEQFPLTVRVSSRSQARPMDVVELAIDSNLIHLFDVDDEHSIIG